MENQDWLCGLFDFNGDGKTDSVELFVGNQALQNVRKSETTKSEKPEKPSPNVVNAEIKYTPTYPIDIHMTKEGYESKRRRLEKNRRDAIWALRGLAIISVLAAIYGACAAPDNKIGAMFCFLILALLFWLESSATGNKLKWKIQALDNQYEKSMQYKEKISKRNQKNMENKTADMETPKQDEASKMESEFGEGKNIE